MRSLLVACAVASVAAMRAVRSSDVRRREVPLVRAAAAPRARRAQLLSKPSTLKEILVEGSRKARGIAEETMERVREAVKLGYS